MSAGSGEPGEEPPDEMTCPSLADLQRRADELREAVRRHIETVYARRLPPEHVAWRAHVEWRPPSPGPDERDT